MVLLRNVNAPQAVSVMDWMRVYWAGAFPPRSPMPLLVWLAKVHTSHAFAYPAGGDFGASSLTTAFVLMGIAAFVRRGLRIVLAILLTPFALGLVAAALERYPYGGSARTMQYVAPSIVILAALGAAAGLARISYARRRESATRLVLLGLGSLGIGMLAWDVMHPYKEPQDLSSRDFARRFWSEESAGAVLLCAREDLNLPLDRAVWRGDRAAVYLCHQSIYTGRRRAEVSPGLDRVSESRPLRVVVFGETATDAATIARWIERDAGHLRLRSRRERVLNKGLRRGRASAEDRYVVYELVPARTGAFLDPDGLKLRRAALRGLFVELVTHRRPRAVQSSASEGTERQETRRARQKRRLLVEVHPIMTRRHGLFDWL